MNHGPPPSSAALRAFGLSGTPNVLEGGQGESFLVRDNSTKTLVILKPTRDIEETEFMCELQTRLVALEPTAYRIAEPLMLKEPVNTLAPDSPGVRSLKYTALDSSHTNGTAWTATFHVSGSGDPNVNAAALLAASCALHSDLRRLVPSPPPCVASRVDRWAWADRYAWAEKALSEIPTVDWALIKGTLKPWLSRLEALQGQPVALIASKSKDDDINSAQLIHGDLSGNLLFYPDLPPAIIDFSPYWRPAAYAEAIVAADLLLWGKGDVEVLQQLGLLEGERLQLLVRATLFRLVTFAIDSDEGFTARNLQSLSAENTVSTLEKLIQQVSRQSYY
jgi:hypothetical protein